MKELNRTVDIKSPETTPSNQPSNEGGNLAFSRKWQTRLFHPKLDWLLAGLLLLLGLLGAWLPVDWTQNLKRPQQAPLYAWFGLAYFLGYAGVGWWLLRQPEAEARYRRKWLVLTVLVLLPNLLNIWLRYSFPLSPTDPRPLFGRDADMGLFYDYGRQVGEGRWPVNGEGHYAEYPQLSLALFWLGAKLAGENRESFFSIFPGLLLLCQLGAGAALYGIGLKLGRARTAFLLVSWLGGCPALYFFNFNRFDIAPAALLLAGVYYAVPGDLQGVKGLAARRRWGWQAGLAGLFVALGTLVKWLPGMLWPWLAAAYWRPRHFGMLARFALVSVLAGLVLTLPLFLLNSAALFYPYQYQGSRKLIGESAWFLVQYAFLDPRHTIPDKPWGEPGVIFLDNGLLVAAQILLIGLALALALWQLWNVQDENEAFPRWLAAGLVGVAVFTLSNRVFSPQYLVLLTWVWAAALLLRPAGWRSLTVGLALMGLAAGANFEVFLLGAYPDQWVRDSAVLFAAGFGLSGFLLWRSLSE